MEDHWYYPLRRSLRPRFECRTACLPPSPSSLSRLPHSSHPAGLLGGAHLLGRPGTPIHPASTAGRRLIRQRSAGRSSGSPLGLWLPLAARHPRLCPRQTGHHRLLPRRRVRSASPYLPRSWPTFSHHRPPHFVRPRHHQPVLRH